MNAKQIVAVRRDNSEKVTIPISQVGKDIKNLLVTIHDNLLSNATKDLHDHTKRTKNWSEFCTFLDTKNIILSPFCGETPCEEKIKADSAR